MAARTLAPVRQDKAMVTNEALNLRLKSLSFCSRRRWYRVLSIAFRLGLDNFFKDLSNFGLFELLDCMVIWVIVPAEQVEGGAADDVR